MHPFAPALACVIVRPKNGAAPRPGHGQHRRLERATSPIRSMHNKDPMNTTLNYRQARLDDIPALSVLRLSVHENRLSSPDKVTLGMYHDYLTTLGQGWLCEEEGEILGFSVADVRDGSIWALFVRPDSEGRGIGRTLLGMACAWLFAQGHPKISLSTGIGTRADRFYAAHGWQRELRPGDREASYTLSAGERHQA